MAKDHERLYAIQPHEYYFLHTGVTPAEEQLLMGLYCPNLIAFRLDGAEETDEMGKYEKLV